LFKRHAKFSRRADVYAAGVVFLELLTLQKPNTLYDDLYPMILEVKLPEILLKCISGSLHPDPEKRIHFTDLLAVLRNRDGNAIKEMTLGSPVTRLTFDAVAADIRLLMPSSKYDYDSGSYSTRPGAGLNSFESFQPSSSAPAKAKRNMFFFKRS
jgi:serine/threonine protein kinase